MNVRHSLLALVVAAALPALSATLGPYAPRFWFATNGDDCYSDGTLAMNGECYALVWQKDGVPFRGFNATGTYGIGEKTTLPVDPTNCRVICVFPAVVNELWEEDVVEPYWTSYCEDARCIVERQFYVDHVGKGKFSVYLFDTRRLDNGKLVVAGCNEKTQTVPVLNGYGQVYGLEDIDMVPGSDYWKIFTGGESEFDPYEEYQFEYGDWDMDLEEPVNSFVVAQSAVPKDATVPCVSAIAVANGKCTLSVTNAPTCMQYCVNGGDTLAGLESSPACVGAAKQGAAKMTWTIPVSKAAGFYKVVRQPLAQ